MPTRNAERFVRESVQSILNQSFRDLELVVSDNASSDNTFEILRSLAGRDLRISLFRNPADVGAAKNFARVLQIARGEYFMWAADHDLWDPTFIEKSAGFLDGHPEYVGCFSLSNFIDAGGRIMGRSDLPAPLGDDPCLRFLRLIRWDPSWYNIVYSLFRRAELSAVFPLPADVLFSDVAAMTRVVWRGNLMVLPEHLYSKRENNPGEDELAFYLKCARVMGMRRRTPLGYVSLLREWLRLAWGAQAGLGKWRLLLGVLGTSRQRVWRDYGVLDLATCLNMATGIDWRRWAGNLIRHRSLFRGIVKSALAAIRAF